MAFICLSITMTSFAQGVSEIKVNEQNGMPLPAIAQKVADAKATYGGFQNIQALQLGSQKQTRFTAALNNQYQILEPIQSVLEKLVKEKPDQLTLSIPTNSREVIKLDLIRVNLLAEGFKVYTSSNDKTPIDYEAGSYYRGVIQGKENNSIASISIFKDQILGSFSSGDGNMVIQALPDFPGQLILFNDKDIQEDFAFECLTDELQTIQKPIQPRGIQASGDCIRVYIECDYALFQNKGSSSATVTWITAVFNNVATLYANESINTTVSEVFVWTTADSYSKTSSIDALNQFKAARPSFNGDLAHLAALGGNNIGGVAWLDVLCSTYKYAYSNISATYASVPTYSWTVEVMTHEMGHNVGSNHTQWCGWAGGAIDNCYTTEGGCPKGPAPTNGGTIMSYCHLTGYGINFNNGFGPLPGDKIRAEVVAANCLGTSCSGGGGCNVPTGLAISNITQTTATATWNAVSGATSYNFEYKTNAGSTWTVVTTTNPTYNITGLTSSTLYNTRVKAVCSSGSSNYSATVNFTTAGSGGGCGTPTNLTVTNITQSTATISWTAVSGATSYNFQYKLASSGTWTTASVTTTTVNLSGMTQGTSYNVRVQAVCGGTQSAYTATVTFTTQNGYCASKGNNSNYEWISRVKLGTIDRVSGKDGGYFNATSLVTDVTKGTTYTMNYQTSTSGSSGTLYWRVWIDFNNNNSFNDAGEQVISVASASTALLSSNFTIPAGAATAKVRMRVSLKYGGFATSCQTYSYGEVEDYSVNIKAVGGIIDPNSEKVNIDEVNLYPNPFANSFIVEFNANQNQLVNILVLDAIGRVLINKSVEANQGRNSMQIETENLAPAGYLIQVKSLNNSHYRKMLKLE
ncbi:MAG: fibronectin type III domain-containing protein [Saprospiraceae bacterium]|nr:fibronectin type III domain-containing protein [Saprospiraceae bacterium]